MIDDLDELIARIQRGDRDALAIFLDAYGRDIRQAARLRIWQLGLEHEVEPDEILSATVVELCQSAVHIKAFDVEELWHYVDRVVKSKATETWRRLNSLKRGGNWQSVDLVDQIELADPRTNSATEIELNEELIHSYEKLNGDERLISMMRRSGWSWEEIGNNLKCTADSVRKRWERAVNKVLRLLYSEYIFN